MKRLKTIMKSLLVLLLTVMLAFTTLVVNTNTVGAEEFDRTDFYRENADTSWNNVLEIARGLGRTAGSASLTEAFLVQDRTNDGKYTLYGYNKGVTVPDSSTTARRYQQAGSAANKTVSVDLYYGDDCLKGVTASAVYYTSGGKLTTTATGNTKLCALAFTNTFTLRLVNQYDDLVVVEHYNSGEHTVNVNNVLDASFASSLDEYYDKYFTTKDTVNNVMSTIISSDYTNADGLVQEYTLDSEATLGGASISVGSNPASTSVTTGVQYLASDYTFSDTHDSNDVLAIDFDNSQIKYYKVNANISITFNFATEVTHDVTFKVGEDVYDSEEVYDGYTVTQPSDPEIPEGYNTFKGWFEAGSDTAYDFSTPVNADLTLYAQFANVRSFTFKNVKSVSASQWVSTFGGTGFTGSNGTYVAYTGDDVVIDEETGSNGLMIRFDYNHAIKGATVKVGSVESELPQEYFQTADDYYLDSEGNWTDEMGDTTENTYIMKLATLENNDYAFLRVWNITDDIEIEVELEDHKVTFVNFGHKYTSSSGTYLSTPYVAFGTNGATWTSETGGTLYASPKAAIDEFDTGDNKGAHHQAVAVTHGDYYEDPTVSSTGVGGTIMTSIADLESIVFTFGENEPIELFTNGDEIKGKTYFINSSYELEQRAAAQEGDLFKLAVSSNTTTTINIRFYDISEDITIEAKYPADYTHTITILNFGNATHNYIGTGAYSTAANGSYVGVRCWDPYGTGTGNTKRNGGTIDYAGGVATIYGDYSNSSGLGAALLVHEDYNLHNKVHITYGEEEVEYDLDNVNGVNQNWYIGETKILQFVQNKNVEYYNVRFFNVAGDITIESYGDDLGPVTASITLNEDGTLTEKINPVLPNYNDGYVATIDDEEVEISTTSDYGKYSVSTPAKAPANLNQNYTVRIFDENSDEIYSTTTSMSAYLYTLYNADPNAAIGVLSKSMLNYGAYCQKYFNVETSDLANKDLPTAEQSVDSVVAVPANDRSVTDELDGIDFYGQSLNLANSTRLKVYFQITSGVIGDYTFKDGETVLEPSTYNTSQGIYYVTIENVAAPDLDEKHTFTVTKEGSEGTLTVSLSVLSYANTVMAKYATSEDQDKINLVKAMKAMYAYNAAANDALDDN